jgi:tungstate transport system substrate-binding protein
MFLLAAKRATNRALASMIGAALFYRHESPQPKRGPTMPVFLILAGLSLALLLPRPAWAGPAATETYGSGPKHFSLATASPGELGLLRLLGEAYCAKAGCALDWVKAGSGQSLDLLQNGQVDMIMVHAPVAEKKALAEGWAGCNALIGSNEFFLVGPPADPAGIAKADSAVDAYRKIAAAKAKFFSRGDDSGTHKKEMRTWTDAGLTPSGDWYVVTKDFMTATLTRANDEGGYFMTDSSTWAVEKMRLPKLTVLFSGDKKLVNTYHALCHQRDGQPTSAEAAGFITFVASPEGQAIIEGFGKDEHGQALYNDAAYAKRYE